LLLGLALAKQWFEYEPLPTLSARAPDLAVAQELASDVSRRLDETEDDPAAEKRFQRALCGSLGRKLYWSCCTQFQPERADIKFADLRAPSWYYAVRPVRRLWK